MFVIGLLIGIPVSPITLLYALPVMLLITFGLVSVGLIIASFLNNYEGFGAIQTFVNLPLFFLSGALFLLKGGSLCQLVNGYRRLEPVNLWRGCAKTCHFGICMGSLPDPITMV